MISAYPTRRDLQHFHYASSILSTPALFYSFVFSYSFKLSLYYELSTRHCPNVLLHEIYSFIYWIEQQKLPNKSGWYSARRADEHNDGARVAVVDDVESACRWSAFAR